MAKTAREPMQLPTHGAAVLPSVTVDSYNLEIEDEEGFVGDRASKGAFFEILEKWRKPLKDHGEDPLGETPTHKLAKKDLAEVLADGEPEAAGLVQSAVEEFAQRLAYVIRRFLRLKSWSETETLVIGGGFRSSRIGELAIGRSAVLLKAEGIDLDLELISHKPDEAGLVGAAHLLPSWMLNGYEGILAVDIGGTNIRAGAIELRIDKDVTLSKARVVKSKLWEHRKEDISRDDAVERLADMLGELSSWAVKSKLKIAPVIGIGCPGVIEPDGSILRGGQNLPGNWESTRFNLPRSITERIPRIGHHETMVVMHNDAVVQGLSALPEVKNRRHWGVLTIGTGLGNARFTNRNVKRKKRKK